MRVRVREREMMGITIRNLELDPGQHENGDYTLPLYAVAISV